MTVSVLRNKVQYGGNSSTTQFTVNFPYTEKSQILVYLNDTLQTITTHYTLTDPDSTGTVTFVTAPCLLYTSPSPRDGLLSRMPSSA